MNEFTDEKMKEFQEAFNLFDKDNDGLINIDEADYAFKCLGYEYSEQEIDLIFKEFGVNQNNQKDNNPCRINFNQFVQFLTTRNKDHDMELELMESFRHFDQDQDGKLNKKEMKYLLLSLGEQLEDEEIEEIIREVDTTGEGAIYYKDFVKIMMIK